MQNSCNTTYPTNTVCFRYVIVNTLHKGDNRDDYDEMMMMTIIIIIIIIIIIKLRW